MIKTEVGDVAAPLAVAPAAASVHCEYFMHGCYHGQHGCRLMQPTLDIIPNSTPDPQYLGGAAISPPTMEVKLEAAEQLEDLTTTRAGAGTVAT